MLQNVISCAHYHVVRAIRIYEVKDTFHVHTLGLISDATWGHWVFRVFASHTCPGNPTGVDQVLTCVPAAFSHTLSSSFIAALCPPLHLQLPT